MHPTTQADYANGEKTRTVMLVNPLKGIYHLTVSTHVLIRYIPDIYWGNVFGKPFIELFGRDRLMSAPAYSVREIGPDCIYLQLSPNIEDVVADYEAFDRAREIVKQHLNSNAFFRPDFPEDHDYNVPDFGFRPDK
jgi:hypothetical protein